MNKPFGLFGHSSAVPRNELQQEVFEEKRDRERLKKASEKRAHDPIGAALGAIWYVANRVFPVLFRGSNISVSRFYPEKNVAVDIYDEKNIYHKAEVDFKRGLFKKNGVKYAAIWHSDEMAHLLEQVI